MGRATVAFPNFLPTWRLSVWQGEEDTKKQLVVYVVSTQDLFSFIVALQNKEFLARAGVTFTATEGVTDPEKSFKNKIHRSEKYPERTANRMPPKDSNKRLQPLSSSFQEQEGGQRVKMLWRDVSFSAQIDPALFFPIRALPAPCHSSGLCALAAEPGLWGLLGAF